MPDGADPHFLVDPETAAARRYDAVVVGSGVSGSLIAERLARAGGRVLVVEAGHGDDITVPDYARSLERFYGAVVKDNNAPYARNPKAPMPRSWETKKLVDGTPDASGYIVQNGPFEIDSTYSRVLGGTTRHWEGKALRMLPDDFRTASKFGRGVDWPVSYEELSPWYAEAERALGVSGEVSDQDFCGLHFPEGYVYPMRAMPYSWLDKMVAERLDGTEIDCRGERVALSVRSTPQARNGIPNPDYDGGRGFRPQGAVSIHQAEMGERCQGNTNCVPICPVQAKYDARRTLFAGLETGRVDLLDRTVACEVVTDGARVTAIRVKSYRDDEENVIETELAGETFVLAANAVENARLLLASGIEGSSGLVGRNLMDHAYLLNWALMPEVAGAFRGPLCTSGIEELRTGPFRSHQAAIRFGIHNDGWGWATGAPYSDVDRIVDVERLWGAEMREALLHGIGKQILLACMIEVPPDPENRVTVDPAHVDGLGNMRPVVSFRISDYTMEAVAYGRKVARQVFEAIGAEDHSSYDPSDFGHVEHGGEGYTLRGGNHWAGTHIMGDDPATSVVDPQQKSWNHDNLYLVGAGSMCSVATSNTTLTLAALCLRTADHLIGRMSIGAKGA